MISLLIKSLTKLKMSEELNNRVVQSEAKNIEHHNEIPNRRIYISRKKTENY